MPPGTGVTIEAARTGAAAPTSTTRASNADVPVARARFAEDVLWLMGRSSWDGSVGGKHPFDQTAARSATRRRSRDPSEACQVARIANAESLDLGACLVDLPAHVLRPSRHEVRVRV